MRGMEQNCMRLTRVDVHNDKDLAKKVKELYRLAFPKEERVAWPLLWYNTKRKDIALTAYLDEELFCGFTVSVTMDGLCYILFLAVAESQRGKGYGSQILQNLQESYEALGLNVEVLDPTASNYLQRKRRFAFYEKNGFYDTGYHVWEVGGKFRVLSTRKDLPMEQVKQVFRKLTLGFLKARTD